MCLVGKGRTLSSKLLLPEVVTTQHYAYNVFANIVDISLHCSQHYSALVGILQTKRKQWEEAAHSKRDHSEWHGVDVDYTSYSFQLLKTFVETALKSSTKCTDRLIRGPRCSHDLLPLLLHERNQITNRLFHNTSRLDDLQTHECWLRHFCTYRKKQSND